MKKVLCCILLLLLSVPMLLPAFSQQKSSMPTVPVRERLQLQLSEEVIAAGMQLWFTAYLSSDSLLPAAQNSQAVYVEILHSNGRQVAASRWPVSGGRASGTLLVPDSLSSGWYTLRAYTQWMRNFPEAAFCHRPLLVINAYRQEATAKPASAQAVRIFPEGGRLVAGLQSRVVFYLEEPSVQQAVVSARVVDQRDSVAGSNVQLQQGLGIFDLRPEAEGSYRLQLITQDKDTISKTLPAIQSAGYVMQVKRQQEHFRVEIQGSSPATDSLKLLLLSEGRVLSTRTVMMVDTLWTAQISSAPFRGRQAQLLLQDGRGNIIAERLVFAQQQERQVQLTLQQQIYAPRDRVRVQLKFKDSRGIRSSLAVRKVHRQLPSTGARLQRAADWYHAWLLTQKLSTQPLPNLPQTAPKQEYPMETEGMLLSGTLTDLKGRPLADTLLLFSMPGTTMPGTTVLGITMPDTATQSYKPVFDYYRTDAGGRFHFPAGSLYGSREVVLQLPGAAQAYRVVVERKFAPPAVSMPYASLPLPPADALAAFAADSRRRQEIRQIYGLYRPDTTATETAEEEVFRFYGTPNFVKDMDDFISLPTFEEVNRELMPGIRLKKSGENYSLSVFDVRTRNFLTGEPMLLIDGVPVYDDHLLLKFSPDSIARLETVNRRTYYGEFPFHGTVAIYSRSGSAYKAFLPAHAHRETLHFYNHLTTFPEVFPAATAGVEKRMPDFRTLIYWQPDLQTDEQQEAVVEFLHADETGVFEVEVCGVNAAGAPFTERITYEVKPFSGSR